MTPIGIMTLAIMALAVIGWSRQLRRSGASSALIVAALGVIAATVAGIAAHRRGWF